MNRELDTLPFLDVHGDGPRPRCDCSSGEPSEATSAEPSRRHCAPAAPSLRWWQVARRRRPPAPQHPFPNPNYADGFPMREPGPVALP